MATLESLPPELIELVLGHLTPSQPELRRLALTAPCFTGPAQYCLFSTVTITNLCQLDLLLSVLKPPRSQRRESVEPASADDEEQHQPSQGDNLAGCSPWAKAVGTRKLRIECRMFGEKGWSKRVEKLLGVACNVRVLELRGLDDLRIKALSGRGPTTLSITSTTFKSNTLPTSPTLATFLSSTTSLTLANLGLPTPSSHTEHILRHCRHKLVHLAISSLRDLCTDELFGPLLSLLDPDSAPYLRRLRFGSLESVQVELLCRADYLPRLTQVEQVGWTFPLPTAELLEATPSGARTLVFKPRAFHAVDRELRMQFMDDEDRVVKTLLETLRTGVLRSGGRGVSEILWGGSAQASARLRAAAGEQIAVTFTGQQ